MRKRPSTAEPEFASQLEAAKSGSWAQLLFQCARLINEHALTQVQQRTGHAVRPSHTTLFPHIDLEGTRPSVLAARLGVSKQAVSQLVGELSQMGLVEQVPDPGDARAHLVRFTDQGRKGLFAGLALLREIETNLASQVGAADIEHMHRTLLRLRAALKST